MRTLKTNSSLHRFEHSLFLIRLNTDFSPFGTWQAFLHIYLTPDLKGMQGNLYLFIEAEQSSTVLQTQFTK